MIKPFYIFCTLLLTLVSSFCAQSNIYAKKTIIEQNIDNVSSDKQNFNFSKTFNLKTWQATIYPYLLRVYGQKDKGPLILMGESQEEQFSHPIGYCNTESEMQIIYSNLNVTISVKEDRLHFYFQAKKPCDIRWPFVGQDPQIKAIIYPDREGLYVPIDDIFWVEKLNDHTLDADFSMPFFGYDIAGETIGYILHTDLRNELEFNAHQGRLCNNIVHHFHELDKKHEYEISLTFTGNSPLGPAYNYKNYLIKNGMYKSLKEKVAENPEISKLFGALHIYVWGTARKIEFLNYINSLGLNRLWIGYEIELDHKNLSVNKQYIEIAKKFGYLIGPYDSFDTMMDEKEADCPTVIFDGIYPDGAIVDSNGRKIKGFQGRGYAISSQSLALQNNKTIYDRIENFLKSGINSYFLDCDAFGELYDDYSEYHQMNKEQDKKNRIARMSYIANEKKMVLGSESVVAWAVPILAFSHGGFAINNRIHWKLTRNKKLYGEWYPSIRPSIFFKTINVPDEYIVSKYDPRYRLPLFQAVFHESIITTDRWEISHMKFSNIMETRELLELLYGIPSIWDLDLADAKKYSDKLKKLFAFFKPFHKAVAQEPITSFRWLTEDRMVQQIVFGDMLAVIANFSNKKFENIPAKSLEVLWLKSNKKKIYTP